jgi:hypothetical protein
MLVTLATLVGGFACIVIAFEAPFVALVSGGLTQAPNPENGRADPRRIAPLPCGRTCPQSQPPKPRAREDPSNKACPSMLAFLPASMLNQNRPDLGIQNRINLKTFRF